MLIDSIEFFEKIVTDHFAWPIWSIRVIMILVFIILLIGAIQNLTSSGNDSKSKGGVAITAEFRWFQFSYLFPFFVIMLADWLQGTNMYTLYSSYGVDVGSLFLTGFLSSALFGTFLGIYVDRWGRRLGCIIFCLLEVIINLLEHIPSMPILLIGRVLGGLSTSLLFSAFESWMVSEHRKRKFPESLLSSTFAISSWGNGVMAILAGFVAQLSSDALGDIGPFQAAIALTVVTLVAILFWRENYGQVDDLEGFSAMKASISGSVSVITKNPAILCLGLSQASFEGAVYTFVFMWVPTLIEANKADGSQALPTGLVFSSFMLAMTIGGMLFGLILPVFPGGSEGLCVLVYIAAAVAMAIPMLRFEFWWIYVAFLVLEAMVGMFYSAGATLRSKYYPESLQSSIMSVFRLPLNLLVVMGTKLTNNPSDRDSLRYVFGVLSAVHVIATLLQIGLLISPAVVVAVADEERKEKDSKIPGKSD